jgi:hypothetical protein
MRPVFNHDVVSRSELRDHVMSRLATFIPSIPEGWTPVLAESSLTITSADKKRIVKLDSCNIYTLDVRKPDGLYTSAKFSCKNADEAWNLASQVLRVHRSPNAT